MDLLELKNYLNSLDEETLQQTATVCLGSTEEAIEIEYAETVDDTHELAGVLDDGHIVLRIDF